jgi:hypothetical protein
MGVLVAMLVAGAFQQFSAWMTGQPDWLQNTIVGAFLLLVPASVFWWPITWAVRRAQRFRANRRAAIEAKRLSFDTYPSELGVVDHGVNATDTMPAVLNLMGEAQKVLLRIFGTLESDKKLARLRKDDPDQIAKKRDILRRIALSLQDDVLALERLAPQIATTADTFIAANRAMLSLPVRAADLSTLKIWNGHYRVTIEVLRRIAEIVSEKVSALKMFDGKQQDLSRVVLRAIVAMQGMAASAEKLAGYCSGEMSDGVTKKISQLS